MSKIVVVGGVTMDAVWAGLPFLSAPGKTPQAKYYSETPGGKGLNQAIAAKRLGASVQIVSAIGNDEKGDRILRKLDEEGIDHLYIKRRRATSTDVIKVEVDIAGNVSVVGIMECTNTVNAQLVDEANSVIASADAILATQEVSRSAIQRAFEIAREHGVITIFNPAPDLDVVPDDLLKLTDYIIPNLQEARIALGMMTNQDADLEILADRLRRKGPKAAIITRSELGCVVADTQGISKFGAFEINPDNTAGASDAFCAAFSYYIAQKMPMAQVIKRATAAAALACELPDTAESMPTRVQLEDFLRERNMLDDTSILPPAGVFEPLTKDSTAKQEQETSAGIKSEKPVTEGSEPKSETSSAQNQEIIVEKPDDKETEKSSKKDDGSDTKVPTNTAEAPTSNDESKQ